MANIPSRGYCLFKQKKAEDREGICPYSVSCVHNFASSRQSIRWCIHFAIDSRHCERRHRRYSRISK